MNDNQSLEHHGVLGMHWGHRKGPSQSMKTRTSHNKNISEDFIKKNNLKKKKISELSNSELKTLNERLQLERQYKDLTKSSSFGQKFVADILAGAAKQTASTYVAKYMSKGVDVLIKKAVK